MPPLERFWRTLEALPGLTGVPARWKTLLESDWEFAKAFLRPRSDLATSYPCLANPPCGCEHRVVERAPDDIVAVCTCELSDCATVRVSREDLTVQELRSLALADAICKALGLRRGFLPLDGFSSTYQVGEYVPSEGFRYHVYLILQCESGDFFRAVEGLLARTDKPFAVLYPVTEHDPLLLELLLKERRSVGIRLADHLTMDSAGQLVALPTAEESFRGLRSHAVETHAAMSESYYFQTPAGAHWGNLDIAVLDGDTIRATVLRESRVLTDAQMGMAQKRNQKPTVEWAFLIDLANGHGTFVPPKHAGRIDYQKRHERLAEQLKKFFRIPSSPIRSLGPGRGWKARFTIHHAVHGDKTDVDMSIRD